jgi:predicted deacylase
MLDTLTFQGKAAGPKLLVLGAIHGNETCGTHAIGRAIVELRSGIFSLDKGSVTFVPVCNPEAYRQNKRYAETNLNRVIKKWDKPEVYEHKLANEVVAQIDACDILLDLHSYGSGTRPFLFIEHGSPEERALAEAMRLPYWVTGWNALYAGREGLWQGDTCTYAFAQGKLALLVECGLHGDPAAAEVAYRCLRAALAHVGLAAGLPAQVVTPPQVNRLHSLVVKAREGKLLKEWRHLDPVAKGTPVLRYDDGETVAAPVDGVVVMPSPTARVGEEWVYFGVSA